MAEQYLAQTQQQRMQMVLAPQLRQSLEMLQVPVLELQSLIQQEIQQNPTLEEQASETQDRVEVESLENEKEDNSEIDFDKEFEVLAKLDDEWREYFQQSQSIQRYTADDEAKRQFFLDSLSQSETLQDHLLSQLNYAELQGDDRQIAEMLIGSVNDEGYLTASLDEMVETGGFDRDHIEHVLSLVQRFDPVGVAARDLRECLLLQLERLGKSESTVAALVRDHLRILGAHKYTEIARQMKISAEDVQAASKFIATLEPKPGRPFESSSTTYVLPEIALQKINGEYRIALNDEHIPHLRISRHYRKLMADPATSKEVKSYIRDKIRAGEFLIKSISQRQQTISRIANEVIDVQRDFFDHGVSHLRPLTMAEIADKLGIHETTVSRAIANKYMQTHRGTFEMKYFFTPGFKTADGKNISNKTIKDAIAQLVAGEDPVKPLSDQQMVETLKERGIKVARRTIAKYRDELKILPSHLRKTV